ncbi:MAG TPA: hypothetical protein VK937_22010 [Candidatus Limnocylindria bacterium]|jgi:hypothetical protein|nr:hypothetical protein [Candidatus Limnocylindria bacterium]
MPDDRAGFLRVCNTWLIEGQACNKRRVLGHAAENRLPVLDGMRRDGEDAVPAEMPRPWSRGVTRFSTSAAVLN